VFAQVTYTALLKGLCSDGLLQDALTAFNEMQAQGIRPNIRTFNTVLRGCMRNCDAVAAEEVWSQLMKASARPGPSTKRNKVDDRTSAPTNGSGGGDPNQATRNGKASLQQSTASRDDMDYESFPSDDAGSDGSGEDAPSVPKAAVGKKVRHQQW